MSVFWYYKKDNLTFEQAQDLIRSIGFHDISKGLVRRCGIRPYRRYHFIHSVDCFSLHEDTKNHTVAKGRGSRERLYRILNEIKEKVKTT